MTNTDTPSPSYQTLFKKNSRILQKESLLSLNFIPDTVVARNGQMYSIAQNLSSILNNGDPSNMYIWGETGVGKTITIKRVLRIMTDGIKEEGHDILIDIVLLNCTVIKSEITACIEILTQLTHVTIKTGLLFYNYLNDIWNVIEKKASEHAFYTLILVFDEIDSFVEPNDILYQFSRALAQQSVLASNVAIEIIAVSNQKDFLNSKLNDKVLSSTAFTFCDFPNYNEDELYEILQLRKDAFVEGVMSDELIRYCAKQVAEKYHGDACRALKILYTSAKKAETENASQITLEHLKNAEQIVNNQVTLEMLQKITLHDKMLILAAHIANKVIKQTKSKLPAHTGIVIEAYCKICELTGAEPNGNTYVSSRIKSLDALQVIRAEILKGHRNTKYIEVSNDVELIIHNLFPQDFNDIINKNYCDIEAVILNKLKNGWDGPDALDDIKLSLMKSILINNLNRNNSNDTWF